MWLTGFLLIPVPFIYAAMRAIEWRWWVAGLRIGEVRFTSDLRNGAFIGLYWKVIGWCMLLLVVLGVWMGIAFAMGYASVPSGLSAEQKFFLAIQQLPFLLMFGFGYIVTALAVGVVIRIYLMRDLWQLVARSVTVLNLGAADNVSAQGELVSALGEGFANSLDVAGF